ncbi:AAA ATPase [Asimina triloba]
MSLLQPARAKLEPPQESSSNKGVVKKVDLFENGIVIVVEIFNVALNNIQRASIGIVAKVERKKVDFAAHPVELNMGLTLLDLLGNLVIPLLLLSHMLLRSASMNTPGWVGKLSFGLRR